MKRIKKGLVTLAVFALTMEPLAAQSHWFQAQSDKAEVVSVVSSSELIEGQYSGKYIYPPINILDGDFDTAWCEAEEGGSGIGETITIELSQAVSFNEIQVVNGFASGNDYYHKNNRVAKITLTQTAGEHFQQKQYTLEDDKEEWQSINFDMTQTAKTLTIKIDAVYRGIKYDDTCLSEIRLLMNGKVIPFENVQKIKVVQEEHSMDLLNNADGAFMKQIEQMASLSRYNNIIYLKQEGSDDVSGLRFKQNFNGSKNISVEYTTIYKIINKDIRDFDFSKSIDNCDIVNINFSEYSKENIPLDDYDKTMDLFLQGKSEFLCNTGYYFSDRNDPRYFLSDYKLTKISNIDYIETSTVQFLRLDGTKGIYINGEYYTVLNPQDFTVVDFKTFGP